MKISTKFAIVFILFLVTLLQGCATKKTTTTTTTSDVITANPICMEKCRRKNCQDYDKCMKPCDALGTNPKAEPCKVRCQLRLTQCSTGCQAHCNAMQPQ